ncbi:hypothetical protein BJ508DRAFT_154263 [Ascobolus immersus RN42]|uniref:Uncharacterized protein n=1 Tax=Ascobolus immersus RN42 TaxID=1160509 RepID=A0A3N4HXK3_ASCIM|nr:hypothetical protein BJ508DRAFT_154263 [Ascobolus immersus RN42]
MDLSALSGSLPANQKPPSDNVLDEFKTAALSVTRLYKAASKAADAARVEGYQNCLGDLLTLLEADPQLHPTTIRAWALERYHAADRERRAGSTEEELRGGREEMERDTAMETNDHGATDQSSMNVGNQYTQEDTPTHSPAPSFSQAPAMMSIPTEMQSWSAQPPSAPNFTFRSEMRAPRHPPPPMGDTCFNLNNAARPHHVQQIRTPPASAGHKRRFEIFEQAAASAERANNNAFKRNKML